MDAPNSANSSNENLDCRQGINVRDVVRNINARREAAPSRRPPLLRTQSGVSLIGAVQSRLQHFLNSAHQPISVLGRLAHNDEDEDRMSGGFQELAGLDESSVSTSAPRSSNSSAVNVSEEASTSSGCGSMGSAQPHEPVLRMQSEVRAANSNANHACRHGVCVRDVVRALNATAQAAPPALSRRPPLLRTRSGVNLSGVVQSKLQQFLSHAQNSTHQPISVLRRLAHNDEDEDRMSGGFQALAGLDESSVSTSAPSTTDLGILSRSANSSAVNVSKEASTSSDCGSMGSAQPHEPVLRMQSRVRAANSNANHACRHGVCVRDVVRALNATAQAAPPALSRRPPLLRTRSGVNLSGVVQSKLQQFLSHAQNSAHQPISVFHHQHRMSGGFKELTGLDESSESTSDFGVLERYSNTSTVNIGNEASTSSDCGPMGSTQPQEQVAENITVDEEADGETDASTDEEPSE